MSSSVVFAMASKPATLNSFIDTNTPTPLLGAMATKLNWPCRPPDLCMISGLGPSGRITTQPSPMASIMPPSSKPNAGLSPSRSR